MLKQESSVAAFGAIHKKVKDKDEANKTVRDVSLRELGEFFKKEDPGKKYAGLRRIGDPNDGTAIWTRVAEGEVDAKLAERATQRRAEDATSRKQEIERLCGGKPKPGAPLKKDEPGAVAPVKNEEIDDIKARLERLEAAKTGCNCVVA